MTATVGSVRQDLGEVDIYLLDQVLRGRITERDVVLDAGCGHGRNAAFLLRVGCRVLCVDADPDAVAATRAMAAGITPGLADADFRVELIEALTLGDEAVSVVVCSAVLHFARNDAQFQAMIRGLWRVLRPGGLFFARLATSIGLAEVGATPIEGRIHRLGDGTRRFLADEAWLMALTTELGGQLADPLKTTIVQGQRCMTTWVVRKRRASENGGS